MKKVLALTLAVIMAGSVLTCGKNAVVKDNDALAISEAKKNAQDIKKAKDDINSLKDQQKAIDKKIKEAQEGIASEQEHQDSINEQISLVEKTIQKYDDAIKKYDEDIEGLGKEITKSEKNIETKQSEIETGVDEFKKRIRVMYINGTDSYTDIIIGAKDFYDMLMKLELVKKVADHDNKMIDNLVELKKQYEDEKKKLEDNKSELETKKSEQEKEKKNQQEQKSKLDGLYKQSKATEEKLKTDKASFEKNKDKIAAEQKAFEDDLQALFKKEEARKKREAEAKRKAEEAKRKAQLQAQQAQQNNQQGGSSNNSSQSSTNNSDYGYTNKSQFAWPVPGFYHISYGVGWRWGAYHQGIDIYSGNIRGAKICASAAGTVIRAVNGCTHDYGKNGSCGCGGGYGNYCIIDHGNGYWTLYGHSERITVSVGQHVSQGQVLGTVGSTGYSTGPHLHFEVRLNGVAQDPQKYV